MQQVLVCIFLAIFLVGCENKQHALWKHQHEAADEQEKLFRVYLTADVHHAREIIMQKISLLENEQGFTKRGHASLLFQEFSRLYAFDEATGDKKASDEDLVKARFWLRRCFEIDGLTSKEIADKMQSADTNVFLEVFEKMDKKATDGKGPEYFQELNKK